MILKHLYLYPDLVEFNTRLDDLHVVRDQTRHICNFIERQLAQYKFSAEGFSRICVIGCSNSQKEMYIHSSQALSVPIQFDMNECRSVPKHKLGDYYAELLKTGLVRCATKYSIPLNEMLGWIDSLKGNDYRNEWTFKEKTFRKYGIKCRLDCVLTIDEFKLRLSINKKEENLFDGIILTTPPDEISFHYRFKDIAIEGDKVVVTDRIGGALFSATILAK